MSAKQLVLTLVLVAFGAETVYVTFQHGADLIDLIFANSATILLSADLVIALSLIVGWMIVDARERGATAWPYVVLTALTGSVGPLLYLIRRERVTSPNAETARA